MSFNYRTKKDHKGRGFFQSTSQSLFVISVFLGRDLGGYKAATQGNDTCLYRRHAYAPTEPVQTHCKGNTEGAVLKRGRDKGNFLSHSYTLTAPHDNEHSAQILIQICISPGNQIKKEIQIAGHKATEGNFYLSTSRRSTNGKVLSSTLVKHIYIGR